MKALYSLLLIPLLWACSSPSNDVEVPTDFKGENLVAIMKDPEQLNIDKIAKIVGEEASKVRIFNENFSRNPSDRVVIFSWPNGEKRGVTTSDGRDLEIEGRSSLGVGFLSKNSAADFHRKFGNKSAVQDEINRITQDENIDADLAIFEAKNLSENAKEQKFEKVGENAYWETPVNALHVFANGVSFTVTTNLENENDSKQKALELVNLIFNKPKL